MATASYVTYESKVNQNINMGKLPKEEYSFQNNLQTTYLELSPFTKGELIFRHFPNTRGGGHIFPIKRENLVK